MTDMLVKLYALPPLHPEIEEQRALGIDIRRTLPPEKHVVVAWVKKHFNDHWGSETERAYSNHPVSCFIATLDGKMIGFACYDATARGFFGPTGVAEVARGKGTGKALLLACLHDMYVQGYGYAAIGGVGPAEFYAKVAGAVEIPDSTPGIYRGLLKNE